MMFLLKLSNQLIFRKNQFKFLRYYLNLTTYVKIINPELKLHIIIKLNKY